MADYEKRVQRLEDIATASSTAERDDILREEIRKRSEELSSSPEMLALPLPDISEEEWAPVREKLLAAAKLEVGKR